MPGAFKGVADVPEHQKVDARVRKDDQWTGPLPPEKAAELIARLKAVPTEFLRG